MITKTLFITLLLFTFTISPVKGSIDDTIWKYKLTDVVIITIPYWLHLPKDNEYVFYYAFSDGVVYFSDGEDRCRPFPQTNDIWGYYFEDISIMYESVLEDMNGVPMVFWSMLFGIHSIGKAVGIHRTGPYGIIVAISFYDIGHYSDTNCGK